MNKAIQMLAGAALLASFNLFAADDVGLVNSMAGDVSYTSGGATTKAKPYMKVREGDRFSVPSGAQLRLVYFQGGRQESFSGPAALTAGKTQSSVQSGGQPQVSTLPSGVPQKIAQTPELVAIAKLGRSGGVAVRGVGGDKRLTPQQQAEVRQARQTYDQLRQSSAADDITPELYLYSVLQDHLLYNDMKPIVAEMQKRQPGNADVAAMADYVKVKTEPAK
ncbi:MAG TPA: hypothetical protein VHL85_08575 [Burkholderiales bacterium]|jgi:hypothetical protein|nr:hypothetical protein [Burkholderiales bacterium]